MKKFLVFILVVLLGVAFYYYLQNYGGDQYATYSNSRYSFEIDYPSDWVLGEQEENNAGRSFAPVDESVYCYAYGFANALQNIQGQPQSLEEFVDWFVENMDVRLIEQSPETMDGVPDMEFIDWSIENVDATLIERSPETMSGIPAVELLVEEEGKKRYSLYTLNDQEGIGFYCILNDPAMEEMWKAHYDYMKRTIRLLPMEEKNLLSCDFLLQGGIEELKDQQVFEDQKYTEVTITSREAWDTERLPKQVSELEGQGYECMPIPFKFGKDEGDGGVPSVEIVQWTCDLPYEEQMYIADSEAVPEGFECTKESCADASGMESVLKFCYR
ncbi:hypothetical protein KJ632_02215 [Patescibacteria group bacterium]|nr:hypothetical protein [Patescibacteria group bacterium]